MVTKSAKANMPLLYAFDAGNGMCKGISSQTRDLIEFEPLMAPLTDKRGITKDDEKPRYSLKIDGQTWVFGVDDVFTHGKRVSMRRFNSMERYTDADYSNLMDVLYLQCFGSYRGNSEYIAPTGVISLPISQYNNDSVLNQVRQTLEGKRTLTDYEGCELRIAIEPKRLIIVPESYGVIMHYAYDPKTLKPRPESPTNGTTLIVDMGFETTDCSLFEGLKYQRDLAFTTSRAGMGVIARAIQEYLAKSIRDANISRIDRAMREIANIKPGSPKRIQTAPGIWADVTEVYDSELSNLAARIAKEVGSYYTQAISRVILGGGGAYHLSELLQHHFSPMEVLSAPDPDAANAYGPFTMLNIQANRE